MGRSFHVEVYRKRPLFGGRQQWSWRSVSDGNGRVLASGEKYVNKQDMLATILRLFGPAVMIQEVER